MFFICFFLLNFFKKQIKVLSDNWISKSDITLKGVKFSIPLFWVLFFCANITDTEFSNISLSSNKKVFRDAYLKTSIIVASLVMIVIAWILCTNVTFSIGDCDFRKKVCSKSICVIK